MPPQNGKSQLISRYFPAWYLGCFPDRKVILAGYEASFAAQWGGKARDLLQEYGMAVFGVTVSQRSSATDHWTIEGHEGSMDTAGIGGPITGKGANVLIIDDPIKNPEEANSPTFRDKIWEWYDTVARTRLHPEGGTVVVMTRWHRDDLAGRLLKEEGWDLLSLPAIAIENDPMGRRPGEALWPQRFPIDFLLKERKAKMDAYNWNSLYQQNPIERGGNILKRSWWQYYDVVPASFHRIVQSWDTAFKTGKSSDYSVCTTWGETELGFFLLDVWRRRVEFPELKRAFVEVYNRWRPYAVVVEDEASGQSLIQEAARGTTIPILPIRVDRDKEARANLITPLLESRRVWVPTPKIVDGVTYPTWLKDFLDECEYFPSGEHDDQVDTLTQALNWMRVHTLNRGMTVESSFEPVELPDAFGKMERPVF